MKKLLFIIAVYVLFFSCEASDACNCVKETYRVNQGITTGPNGLPVLTSSLEILNTENIECNEEVTQQSNGNGTYFNIKCD